MANFSVVERDLSDIIDDIKKCELQIPNFQRDYVWTPNQIKALLDSIRKGIPLGALITWDVPNAYTSHFCQYLSKEDQVQGGWIELDLSKMSSKGWLVKKIPFSKSKSLPAIKNVKSSDFQAIIDGRQRTQSLLMAFGGITYGYNPHKLAKIWYLDLDMDIAGDENPFGFVKVKDVLPGGNFDTLGKWIDSGRYPLWWSNDTDYQTEMMNTAHYVKATLPTNLSDRMKHLTSWIKILSGTGVAKITLSKNVDLSMVCEVFETLNEAGTKVSAFDIVHATLIGSSKGNVNLKARLEGFANETVNGLNPGLKAWTTKKSNWKNISQGITLAYCLSPELRKKFPSSKTVFTSVKGDAMIATPPEYYAELLDLNYTTGKDIPGFVKHKLLEDICISFHKVTRGNAGPQTRWCPSPILFSFYLALRLKLEYSSPKKFSLDSLNDAFRAYYWRAVSTSLYDQGYLTMIYAHTKKVGEFLEKNEGYYSTNPNTWWSNYENEIQSFTTPVKLPDKTELIESLKDPKVAGTIKNMLMQCLFAFVPQDIKSGKKIHSIDEPDLELHHIFPQKWINDNISKKELKELRKSIAVLVPMLSKPNNEWKAKDPKVALNKWHKNDKLILKNMYISLGIPTNTDICHNSLNDDTIGNEKRLKDFIDERSEFLAEKIIELSSCKALVGFSSW